MCDTADLLEHCSGNVIAVRDKAYLSAYQSCAPTNWWSAAALGGLMTGGGGGAQLYCIHCDDGHDETGHGSTKNLGNPNRMSTDSRRRSIEVNATRTH